VNEIILAILPEIEKVVSKIVYDPETRHDLKQDLILKCYENEGKVRRLYVETGMSNWLFMTARNININRQTKVKEYLTPVYHNDLIDSESVKSEIDFIKSHEELLKQLPDPHRRWVQLYIKHDFNYLEIERQGICGRRCAKKNIQKAFEVWRSLDIFLPHSL
jgi:DNA-directed RNA polymerase specialized sigma24 family protein